MSHCQAILAQLTRRSLFARTPLPTSILLLLVAGPSLPAASHAQVVAGADVGFATDYVWRGITRTTKPVLQPGLYVGLARSDAYLAVGGWTSVEPWKADSLDLSDTGVGRGGIGEVDVWAEGARRIGSMDIGAGWIGYFFRASVGEHGRDDRHNANEIYGRAQVPVGPLTPKLVAWYDLDYAKGAYLECSLDLRLPLLPLRTAALRTLHLTALAGWSLGQESRESDPSQGAHFDEAGLTHADIATWSSFVIADDWSIAAEFHFQINADPATRRTHAVPSTKSDTKVWFAITASWAHWFSSVEEEAA